MAYQSGNYNSVEDFFDNLITFMTGSCGWTKLDTITVSGSRDVILFSPGTNNKMNMLYRIQTNELTGTNPYKDPGDSHTKWPYVWARGYSSWNSSSLSTPVNYPFTPASGLLPTGTYFYRISAYNATGETAASAETSITLTASSGVQLSWIGVTGALGYNVYGRSGSAEAFLFNVPSGTVTQIADSGTFTQNNSILASNISASARVGGAQEYGVWGPLLTLGDQQSNLGTYMFVPIENASGSISTFPVGPIYQDRQLTTTSYEMYAPDGHRRIWGANTTGLTIIDFGSPDQTSINLGQGTLNFNSDGVMPVRDPTTNEEYIYLINENAQGFYRYAVNGGSVALMTPPPAVLQGAAWCWDGADSIYIARGNSSTSFYKYSISANSWTSLAVLPVTYTAHSIGSSTCNQRMVYIPKVVTGQSSDCIYFIIADSSTILYRYDVSGNSWSSTIQQGGALSLPITSNAPSLLFWDRQKFLYYGQPGTSQNDWWRTDLGGMSALGTWVQIQPTDTTTRVYLCGFITNQIVSKARVNNVLGGKYFFHGDQDSVRVVARIGSTPQSGQYYWMYMGKYDTMYQNQIMGIQSAATSGTRVSISVDSNSGFSAGQQVMVVNWASGTSEKTTLYSTSGSTFVTCNLVNNYPSGSIIAVDPCQSILAGDSGIGITNLDSAGYKTDFEPAWYYVQPLFTSGTIDNLSPSTRQAWMPTPFKIFNDNRAFNNFNTSIFNHKYETLGFLRNVYSLEKKSFPSPQNEDLLAYQGHNYIYFNLQEVAANANDTRGIVIGPIS